MLCYVMLHERIAGSGVNPRPLRVLLKLSADTLLVFQLIAGSALSGAGALLLALAKSID